MKSAAFEELLTSVRQAGRIGRGTLKPGRVTAFRPAQVKAIRSKLRASQPEFAMMIGVSVATLRNWEQGRRTPDGPALALLRVAAKNPELAAEALHGKKGAAYPQPESGEAPTASRREEHLHSTDAFSMCFRAGHRKRRSRGSQMAMLAWEQIMTRVRVHNFTISLDGYGAGPRQTREDPLGVGGEALHDWYVATRTFQRMGGKAGGTTGVDDDFAARFGKGVGAWIMGRNMFGPIRGPWPDDAWRGWWGKNPPYHGPVFVLTHHARPPAQMEGGTVFHFVTGGIREALERATAAAAGKDVQIGGGVATVRQYLEAGLIDELHVAIAPRLLGSGEHLSYGLDLTAVGYECTTHVPTVGATHVVLTRRQ